MYTDIVRRLKGSDQKESPRKMENQQSITISRQCSSTPVGFDQGFIGEEQCDNIWSMRHNLVPSDLCPFARLKSEFKERLFFNAIDIIRNATEELKRLSQNGFQECFQHLYSHWQKCTFAQRDYFEGNVHIIIVMFCTSKK
jgi:hypothetical protein